MDIMTQTSKNGRFNFCIFCILFYISVCSGFLLTCDDSPVFVGSFNVKHFGVSKMANHTVASYIARISSRWDIFLLIETRDKTGTALQDLWGRLNRTNGEPWGMVQSEKLGRSAYKEQYVFFYKTSRVTIRASHLVPDPQDVYEREPFSVEIEHCSKVTGDGATQRLALLGFHSRPRDTPNELRNLSQTIKTVAQHFTSSSGVIALGDFNADCSYLSNKAEATLEIFQENSVFRSLIPGNADSTVAGTVCAYDRVVVLGKDLDVRNAKVFNFQKALNLSHDMAEAISDHYPVQFHLY